MERCKMCWRWCGRKKSSTDNESADAVMQVFVRSPKKSLRQCSREIGIEKSSFRRILPAQKWKPYIPWLVHALNEGDPHRRLQLCEWFPHKCDERKDFQDTIVWSDEATFKFNGTINWYNNCVYWSNEKPKIIEEKTVNLPGVAVWCDLSSRGLIGHSFFKETVRVRLTCKCWKSWFHDFVIPLRMKMRCTSNKTGLHLTFMSMWTIFSIAHSIRDE